jgi:hypothetical protein
VLQQPRPALPTLSRALTPITGQLGLGHLANFRLYWSRDMLAVICITRLQFCSRRYPQTLPQGHHSGNLHWVLSTRTPPHLALAFPHPVPITPLFLAFCFTRPLMLPHFGAKTAASPSLRTSGVGVTLAPELFRICRRIAPEERSVPLSHQARVHACA